MIIVVCDNFNLLISCSLQFKQDDTDGTCLGPSGFSECGDATLWKIRRRQAIFPRRRKQTGQTGATVEVKGKMDFLSTFYVGRTSPFFANII